MPDPTPDFSPEAKIPSLRVLVTGGRDFNDQAMVERALADLPEDAVIVHGAARGADFLADAVWHHQYRATEPHQAQWALHGKAAGVIRNQEMLDTGIDLVIAFPGGRGTADMVRRARAAGVEVRNAN